MKSIIIALPLFLTACVPQAYDAEDNVFYVCKGLGCAKKNAVPRDPYNIGVMTHKPTQDERLRIMTGGKPDFGAGEISVGGTIKWPDK